MNSEEKMEEVKTSGRKYVKIRFSNNKTYSYNCPFEAKVGDIAFVEGAMADIPGEVIEVDDNWSYNSFVKEVSKLMRNNFNKHLNGFDYLIANNSFVKITECKIQDTKQIIVPEKIEGLPVVEIGEFAFDRTLKELESIVLPETIKKIGKGAFRGHSNLTLFIPKNVNEIDFSAFKEIKKLEISRDNRSFSLSNHFILSKDGEKLFGFFCPSEEKISILEIPESVVEIFDNFSIFIDISELKIHKKVRKIGENFLVINKFDWPQDKTKISIQLPDYSILHIHVDNRDEIYPKILSCIGTNRTETPFNFKKYDEVIYESGYKKIKIINILYRLINSYNLDLNQKQIFLDYLSKNCEEVFRSVFEYNDENLKQQVFEQTFYSAKSIIKSINAEGLKDNQEFIEKAKFFGNERFQDFKILFIKSLETEKLDTPEECFETEIIDNDSAKITKYIHEKNKNKTFIRIPNEIGGKKVTSLGRGAFSLLSIQKVFFSYFIKSIEKSCFYGCEKLWEIELNTNLQFIGESAFENCKSIKKISLLNPLIQIEERAFQECQKLEKIHSIEGGKIFLNGSSCFKGTSINANDILKYVQGTIPWESFNQNDSLSSATLKIPDKIMEINGFAFGTIGGIIWGENCSLKEMGYHIASMNRDSFGEEFNLPESLENLNSKPFYVIFSNSQDQSIPIINLPNGIKKLKNNGAGSFIFTMKMSNVNIENMIENSESKEKIRLGRDDAFLEKFFIPGYRGKKEVNGATYLMSSLGTCVLWRINSEPSIKEFIVPNTIEGNTVNLIAPHAFSNNQALNRIVFENNSKIEIIAGQTFFECRNLIEVCFPRSIKRINYSAFWDCPSLKTINFPSESELEYIDEKFTFLDPKNIKRVILPDEYQERLQKLEEQQEIENDFKRRTSR